MDFSRSEKNIGLQHHDKSTSRISTIKEFDLKCVYEGLSDYKKYRNPNLTKFDKLLIHNFDLKTGILKLVEFSPCGLFLATSESNSIKVFNLQRKRQEFILKGHFKPIQCLSYSNCGNFLASGSQDHTVKLWNIQETKCEFTFYGHTDSVSCLSFSPTEKLLATGSNDESIKLWDLVNKLLRYTLTINSNPANFLSFTFDGQFLLSSIHIKDLGVWNVQDMSFKDIYLIRCWTCIALSPMSYHLAIGNSKNILIKDFSNPSKILATIKCDNPYHATFSPNENYLAILTREGVISLWNFLMNEYVSKITDNQFTTCLSFSHDSRYLAMISKVGIKVIFNLKKQEYEEVVYAIDQISAVAVSPDGRFIAAASFGKPVIKIWNIKEKTEEINININYYKACFLSFSANVRLLAVIFDISREVLKQKSRISVFVLHKKEEIFTLEKNKNIECLAMSSDGIFLAISGYNLNVEVYNMMHKRVAFSLMVIDLKINCIHFSNNGRFLAVGTNKSYLKLWDLKNKKIEYGLKGHSDSINCLTFSCDSKLLISGSEDKTIRFWNLAKKIEQVKLKCKNGPVFQVHISINGKRLIVVSNDKSITVWNVVNQTEKFTLKNSFENQRILSFSPDLKFFVTEYQKSLGIYPLKDRREEYILETHKDDDYSRCLQLSPDGGYLGIAIFDYNINVWNIQKNKSEFIFKGPSLVRCICFNIHSNLIAAGYADSTIIIWDIKRKCESFKFIGHLDSINYIAFSPNSEMLLTKSDDMILKIWYLTGKKENYQFNITINHLTRAIFSCDSKILAIKLSKEIVYIFNLNSKTIEKTIKIYNLLEIMYTRNGHLHGIIHDVNFQIYDLMTKRCKYQFDFSENIEHFWFSTDGSILFEISTCINLSIRIKIYNFYDETENTIYSQNQYKPDSPKDLIVCSYCSINRYTAVGLKDQSIEIWTSNEEIIVLKPLGNGDYSLMRQEKQYLCLESQDNTLNIINIQNQSVEAILKKNFNFLIPPYTSVDENFSIAIVEKYLIVGYNDNSYDMIEGLSDSVSWISYIKKGKFMILGNDIGDIKCYNFRTKEFKILTKSFFATCVSFSRLGNLFAAGIEFSGVIVWDLNSNTVLQNIDYKSITCLIFSPVCDSLVLGGCDNMILVYNMGNKEKFKLNQNFAVEILQFSRKQTESRNQLLLYVACKNRMIFIWDFKKRTILVKVTVTVKLNEIQEISLSSFFMFSLDKKLLMIRCRDLTTKVFDLTGEKEVIILRDFSNIYNHALFSPDNKFLLTISLGKINVWELETGKFMFSFKIHLSNNTDLESYDSPIVSESVQVSFSSEGRYLNICTDNSILRISFWNKLCFLLYDNLITCVKQRESFKGLLKDAEILNMIFFYSKEFKKGIIQVNKRLGKLISNILLEFSQTKSGILAVKLSKYIFKFTEKGFNEISLNLEISEMLQNYITYRRPNMLRIIGEYDLEIIVYLLDSIDGIEYRKIIMSHTKSLMNLNRSNASYKFKEFKNLLALE